MNALLTVVVFWLSMEFGLPAIYQHPRVEFVPPAKIGSLHDKGFASRRLEAAQSQSGQRMTVSVYDDATKTIYLPESWTGGTPAELSILVHEMVHHLQNLGKRKFHVLKNASSLLMKRKNGGSISSEEVCCTISRLIGSRSW